MRDLVVVDDSTITAMLGNTAYLELLPCLQNIHNQLRKTRSGCGGCRKETNNKQIRLRQQARDCIRQMSGEQRTQFKKLLNTKRYRLFYRNASGVLVKMTY